MKKGVRSIALTCIGIFCFSIYPLASAYRSDSQTLSQQSQQSVESCCTSLGKPVDSVGIVAPQSTPQTTEISNTEISSASKVTSEITSSQTNIQVDISSQSEAVFSQNQSSNVPDERIVYAVPNVIQKPKKDDFGAYYETALSIYNQFLSGVFEQQKTYEFPHLNQIEWDANVKEFFEIFQSTCLKDIDNKIIRDANVRSMYHQFLDNTSGKTKIIVQLDKGYFNEYQNMIYTQNTIQAIVGDGIPETMVVSQITDWCIRNCSYNYGYQYSTEEYRGLYTIVKNLLQNKTGICDDFSKLVNVTCDIYGIRNEYIGSPSDGRPQSQRHAWNRICISGTWYYIDVAWSVCAGYNAYPLTEELWKNHETYL